MELDELKKIVEAQQEALKAVVGAISGTNKLTGSAVIAALRDAASEQADAISKDTIQRLLPQTGQP